MIKPLVLAGYNWKVLLKSLVYQMLLLALIVALGYLIFGNLVDDVLVLWRENHIGDFMSETVGSIVNGSFDSEKFSSDLGNLITQTRQSIASLRIPFGGAAMAYVLFCLIFVAYRVFVSLTDVTASCQLEEFMTSNAERPFTWFFIKKMGTTWKFILLQTALTLPMDLLILGGCLAFYALFLLAFSWWTVIPVLLIAVLLYVARLSMFAYTLPAVVCSEGSVRKAFKQGLANAMVRFWHVFWKTLIVVGVMLVVTVLCLMYIANPILKTAVTSLVNFVLYFYLKCVNMVEFFRFDNRPFFYKRVEIEGTDRYNRKLARRNKAR